MTNRYRWIRDYQVSLLAGVVAAALGTSVVVAQSTIPPMIERNLVTIISAVGVLWVGWWRIGRLEKDFERSIVEREKLKAEYVRLDRFEDYRTVIEQKLDQMIERIDGLHQSVREIRKLQLHRSIIGDKLEEAGP